MLRHGLKQRIHERDIHHEQIAVERVVLCPGETAELGIDLQQAVDRLGLNAGLFGHALGRATRRGRESYPHALGREDAQDRVEERRLTYARATRDDRHLGADYELEGLAL